MGKVVVPVVVEAALGSPLLLPLFGAEGLLLLRGLLLGLDRLDRLELHLVVHHRGLDYNNRSEERIWGLINLYVRGALFNVFVNSVRKCCSLFSNGRTGLNAIREWCTRTGTISREKMANSNGMFWLTLPSLCARFNHAWW